MADKPISTESPTGTIPLMKPFPVAHDPPDPKPIPAPQYRQTKPAKRAKLSVSLKEKSAIGRSWIEQK